MSSKRSTGDTSLSGKKQPNVDEYLLNKLMGLGFKRKNVVHVLQASDNEFDEALNMLLDDPTASTPTKESAPAPAPAPTRQAAVLRIGSKPPAATTPAAPAKAASPAATPAASTKAASPAAPSAAAAQQPTGSQQQAKTRPAAAGRTAATASTAPAAAQSQQPASATSVLPATARWGEQAKAAGSSTASETGSSAQESADTSTKATGEKTSTKAAAASAAKAGPTVAAAAPLAEPVDFTFPAGYKAEALLDGHWLPVVVSEATATGYNVVFLGYEHAATVPSTHIRPLQLIKGPSFVVSQLVEACFTQDQTWYSAIINAVLPNNLYSVVYAEYGNQENLPADQIRTISSFSPTLSAADTTKQAAAAPAVVSSTYAVHDTVEACYTADQKWYQATIVADHGNGTYRVMYAGYLNEEDLPESEIRPISGASASLGMPAVIPGQQAPSAPAQQQQHTYAVGEYVEALFSDDNIWYPAQITDVSGDSYTVLYVTYGNKEVRPPSCLRPLPASAGDAAAAALAGSMMPMPGFTAMVDPPMSVAQTTGGASRQPQSSSEVHVNQNVLACYVDGHLYPAVITHVLENEKGVTVNYLDYADSGDLPLSAIYFM
ncbi:hypothetical protein H696_03736 [Fonticula alba]|uniref:Tudor domain-containing protein n=1 Tax=Fonticula alba TaxID=691883 RepID=A0A058Z4U0_FONAL|nr:hypothetical protein H696_03736 [Fonticula alba]KCV69304.1 hypothetical protein H696_03736 [Fonticula alba]|eukprot:XP_009495869.1 hypothetical protein H696_03736 [Fonticula alba]